MAFEATGKISTAVVAVRTDASLEIAAVAGKRLRLLGGLLVAGAAGCTFAIYSELTAISGVMVLGANANMNSNLSEMGYCDTAVGQRLRIVASAGALNGVIRYQEIN